MVSLGREEYLKAVGGFNLTAAFPDLDAHPYHWRVDPYEPNRCGSGPLDWQLSEILSFNERRQRLAMRRLDNLQRLVHNADDRDTHWAAEVRPHHVRGHRQGRSGRAGVPELHLQ